jgi:hypothetical protein
MDSVFGYTTADDALEPDRQKVRTGGSHPRATPSRVEPHAGMKVQPDEMTYSQTGLRDPSARADRRAT